MDLQPFDINNVEDPARQGDWEQRVNERELRYLQLLEQRIEILERNNETPLKHQPPVEILRPSTRIVRRPSTRIFRRGSSASTDSSSGSERFFTDGDGSVSDISAPYQARRRSRGRRIYVRDSSANSRRSSFREVGPLEKGPFQAGDDTVNLERVLFKPKYRIVNSVDNNKDKGSYAFKWITTRNIRDGAVDSQAVIPEGNLQRALADELQDFPIHFNGGDVFFSGLFDVIVQAWDRFESIVAGSKPEVSVETRQDLNALLYLIREVKELKNHFNNRNLDSGSGAVVYGALWLSFAPGTVIYASPMDSPQAFLVHSWLYKQRSKRTMPSFVVLCWSYDFDGEKFNRVRATFVIPTYPGKKAINSLPCYPLEAHENCQALSATLIERGKTFRELCTKSKGHQMFNYKGEVIFTQAHEEGHTFMDTCFELVRRRTRLHEMDELTSGSTERKAQYEGPVIVDAKLFKLYGPPEVFFDKPNTPIRPKSEWFECDCTYCRDNVKLRDRMKTHYDGVGPDESGRWPEFEDVQLMICEPRLRAYALAKKTWVEIDVNSVQTVQEGKSEDALDHLCLADDEDSHSTKRMIQSLVLAHTLRGENKRRETPDQLQDFVEGKGQGLVILLHGTSGVGKTLTAESVAKATGKPLLKVSIADIGTDVTKVEQKLDMMFQLATAWEAILLFDEADILLEARAIEDNLVRNAIVSVFLKILEYYEGILFLTTNRIKTFDIAVQSRVNLGVHFSDMGERQQKRLLTMFLDMIDERQIRNKGKILEWIREDFRDRFNGREIRNMLSSAMALARADGRPLELSDIKVIRDSKRNFKDYLQEQTILAKQRNE